jgi:drug/metabolite transporter (DMT)-like permease
LKYGLLAGFATCLWILAEYALGLHTRHLDLWQYTDAASFLVFIVPMWRMLRRRQAELGPGAALPLGEVLLRAMGLSLVAALVIYIFMVAYTRFLNPAWVDTVLDWKIARWRAARESEESIRQQIAAYRHRHTPAGMAAMLVITTPLLGGILAIFLIVWLNLRAQRAR